LGIRALPRMLGRMIQMLAVCSFLALPQLSQAACTLGLVDRNPEIVPVSFTQRDVAVSLRWLGHSSFLLTTPGGTSVVMDPIGRGRLSSPPTAVTVSNRHPTHSNVAAVPGNPVILWGVKDGRWQPVEVTLRDLRIFNVESNVGAEPSLGENSVFVFEWNGLCIAHLGNLRHKLTPEMMNSMGKIHVVLIPISWAVELARILEVIGQLRPAVAIPMHFDSIEVVERFVSTIAGKYPVRRYREDFVLLTRNRLPASTEIFILGSPAGREQ